MKAILGTLKESMEEECSVAVIPVEGDNSVWNLQPNKQILADQ